MEWFCPCNMHIYVSSAIPITLCVYISRDIEKMLWCCLWSIIIICISWTYPKWYKAHTFLSCFFAFLLRAFDADVVGRFVMVYTLYMSQIWWRLDIFIWSGLLCVYCERFLQLNSSYNNFSRGAIVSRANIYFVQYSR